MLQSVDYVEGRMSSTLKETLPSDYAPEHIPSVAYGDSLMVRSLSGGLFSAKTPNVIKVGFKIV
jgi:hypothetical protein